MYTLQIHQQVCTNMNYIKEPNAVFKTKWCSTCDDFFLKIFRSDALCCMQNNEEWTTYLMMAPCWQQQDLLGGQHHWEQEVMVVADHNCSHLA